VTADPRFSRSLRLRRQRTVMVLAGSVAAPLSLGCGAAEGGPLHNCICPCPLQPLILAGGRPGTDVEKVKVIGLQTRSVLSSTVALLLLGSSCTVSFICSGLHMDAGQVSMNSRDLGAGHWVGLSSCLCPSGPECLHALGSISAACMPQLQPCLGRQGSRDIRYHLPQK
jgi:hypothetical protein